MPAAIITSDTSAFWVSRRTARSFIRSRSAARPTAMRSSVRWLVLQSPTGKLRTSWKTSPQPIWNCGSGRTNYSSTRSNGSVSSPSGSASMLLVENGRIVEDRYVRILDDAAIPDRIPVIVPANRLLADAHELVRRDGSLGVLWPNDRRVAELEPWLGHLALIALVFPKFRDGRAYSQARLLRETYGFRGTLRATGDVLRDQFT